MSAVVKLVGPASISVGNLARLVDATRIEKPDELTAKDNMVALIETHNGEVYDLVDVVARVATRIVQVLESSSANLRTVAQRI